MDMKEAEVIRRQNKFPSEEFQANYAGAVVSVSLERGDACTGECEGSGSHKHGLYFDEACFTPFAWRVRSGLSILK